MEYVLVGCRGVVALVFVMSATSKLRSRRAYAEFVAATGHLAPWQAAARYRRPLAIAVLAVEVAVPVLLVNPLTLLYAFVAAGTLLAGLTTAVLLALRRGRRVPCRCFGASERPLGRPQVVRNLILVAIVAAGLIAALRDYPMPELPGAAVAAAAGGITAFVIVSADDIVGLFRAAH